jgi:hypothetical protein
MEDFLLLIKRNDCCIHYKKLEEYGILKFKDSADFKRIMEKNQFIENKDFETRNVAGLKSNNPKSR